MKPDLFQGCKDSSIYSINQCDTPYNKLKDKNHMIISIYAEKPLKNSAPIYDKKKKIFKKWA